MAPYTTEPIHKEIISALELLDIDKERLEQEGYRSKNSLWGRIVQAAGKTNTLARRRQFYDVWRKTGAASQELGNPGRLLGSENDLEEFSKKSIQVYGVINHCLSMDEAVRVLTNVDRNKLSLVQPVAPRSGELYMYICQKGQENQGWRPEHGHWTNMGSKRIHHMAGILKVRYFINRSEGRELKRRVYELCGNVIPHMLVHYLDESSHFQRRKNVKHGQQPIERSPPEVIEKDEETMMDLADAQVHCEKINSESQAGTSWLSSLEQLPKSTKWAQPGNSLNPSDLMATHLLCRELKEFVINLSVYPEVTVIAALPEMIEQFQAMVKNSGPQVPLVLYYNTTFGLENFNVTPLLFCHNAFKEGPAVPLAFLIQQHQEERAHIRFLEELVCLLPDINSERFVICTDCEAIVENSVKRVLPRTSAVSAWSHLLNHVKRDMKKKCALEYYSVHVYISDFKHLLCSETEGEWNIKLEMLSMAWSPAFSKYFQIHLEVLMKRSARFSLKNLGLLGNTVNPVKGFKMLLNGMLDRKLSLENLVFTAFQILKFFLNEVLRSYCNMGIYHLANMKSATVVEDVKFPEDVLTLDEIDDFIKDSIPDEGMSDQEDLTEMASKWPMAKLIIAKNKITLEARLQSFSVRGWRGQTYTVRLAPSEHCSCARGRQCCHILAARMAIGLEEERKEKGTFRLRKLCRNAGTTGGKETTAQVFSEALLNQAAPLEEVMSPPRSPAPSPADGHNENYLVLEDPKTSTSSSGSSESSSEDDSDE